MGTTKIAKMVDLLGSSHSASLDQQSSETSSRASSPSPYVGKFENIALLMLIWRRLVPVDRDAIPRERFEILGDGACFAQRNIHSTVALFG